MILPQEQQEEELHKVRIAFSLAKKNCFMGLIFLTETEKKYTFGGSDSSFSSSDEDVPKKAEKK